MAGVKDAAQRFGMLFMAVLFLVTSLAFTGVVVWQFIQEGKQEEAANSEYLNDLDTVLDPNETDVNQKTEEQDMLQGTKLEGFTPPSGRVAELQIIDLKKGDGAEVKADSTVTAHYTGALAKTGVIFQSSHDSGSPFTSGLNGVIQGWTQGLPGMKAGGTRRLIIPASLAYGEAGSGSSIPGDSDLVFDIELISVE